MIGDRDLWMAHEHYWELRREAEQERLKRQARSAGARVISLQGRALSWLGGQLVAWGQHLQTRYGRPAPLISSRSSQLVSK